ncbi:toprim domain-containing protein, partial [bacterium]|nr:toprim domain-containing protein [bacterium]
ASSSERERYQEICQLFAQYSHEQLLKQPKIIIYLEKRGFSLPVIKQFCLGYLPGGMRSINRLIGSYKEHNILAQNLVEAKLVRQQKAVFFSPFEERLIFPIQDHIGRFCGFGGRVLREQDTRAKYYNSAENKFFNKSSLLFGLSFAKKSIQKEDSVFLVEGYTDCLAMVQHGYTNTVATLGTACTPQHLTILARYAQRLYVVYDSDSAGEKAVLRLTQMSWNANLDPFVIRLPKGHDPATYLKENSQTDLKKDAQDIFVFFIDTLGKNISQKSTQERIALTRKLLDTISHVKDPLRQEILLHRSARQLNLPFDVLKTELQKQPESTQEYGKEAVPAAQPTQNITRMSMLEKRLFSVILKNLDLVGSPHDTFYMVYLSQPLRDILKKLQLLLSNNKRVDFNTLYERLNNTEQKCVDRLLVEVDDEPTEHNFKQLITQFHKQHWRSIVSDVKQRVAQADKNSPEQINTILKEFETLKKQLLSKGTTE